MTTRESVRQNFGEAFKAATEGQPVADIAEAMEVSRGAVYKWREGQSVPDIDKLPKLERVVGVAPGTFRRIILGDEPDVAHLDVSDLTDSKRRELLAFLAGLRRRDDE